jgi:hypothetical protein
MTYISQPVLCCCVSLVTLCTSTTWQFSHCTLYYKPIGFFVCWMIFWTGVYTPGCFCTSNASPHTHLCMHATDNNHFSENGSWDSSVSIVVLYGLEGLVMEFQWEWGFLYCPHWPHGQPRHLCNGYRVFTGEKRPEHHADHLPPASTRLWMVGAIPLPPLFACTDLYLYLFLL